jgi:hypothetical protein
VVTEATTKTNGRAAKPETKTRAEAGTREKIVRQVHLRGLTDIMFCRYAGDNDTKLEPWQKLYLGGEGGRTICLPSANVMSFLSAQNTDSAPKRLLDPRKYKRFALACGSFVMIDAGKPDLMPFLRDGEPVEFGRIDGKRADGWQCDGKSGVYIRHDVARLEKGIPNPQARPVLPLPWDLKFTLTLWPNKEVQEQQLLNVFTDGLIAIGLGTWRGRFGKAEVVSWE